MKTMKMTISQLLFKLSRKLLLFTYHPRFEIYKAKPDSLLGETEDKILSRKYKLLRIQQIKQT